MTTTAEHPEDCECQICQGMSWREVYEERKNIILQHGRCILGVLGDEEHIPFSYTIGNQAKGLPELLLIGTHRGTYLDKMSERMIEQGGAFDHGEIIKTGEKYRIKIINATQEAHENYTIQAGDYYETQDYQVQQIILSDEEGRLLIIKARILFPFISKSGNGVWRMWEPIGWSVVSVYGVGDSRNNALAICVANVGASIGWFVVSVYFTHRRGRYLSP